MDEVAAGGPRERPAYGMAVAVAVVSGVVAVVCALVLGQPLRDPDGFLGPTYVRLPLIAAMLLAADILPRAVRRAGSPRGIPAQIRDVARERWPWRRLRPVLIGLAAFYVTYVAYRNLKNYLPQLRPDLVDAELAGTDRWITGGVAPAEVLHALLGTGAAAHVLSWVYLAFLVFVPASLGLALVLQGRAGHASWYVTALCLNWALGTASYYVLPSMGPIYAQPALFWDLPETGVSRLQDSLLTSRWIVLGDPDGTDRLNSIAAFASLHTSIILTAALIAQFVVASVAIRAALWAFFALTALATIYFGWHYLLDDVAGLAIAVVAVLLAAWGTGQFRRRRTPVPVPDGSAVPVARERRRRSGRRPEAAPSPS
ncbi:inositol phosphorylceramide synthase [Blastococcus sp. TBT05-19]|uniref:phosphatase PAP2 family protein n=1 Tax=Blastococcus sp. TBT05-19 TaxID=2250581 RepID=UPI000DEBC9F9|nr:phosphatase PAP2 family protein [Blastococcus sp. TBT05-19]RBY94222.1 inositol phosphorylceramide synthase [Blastococcus sp. TBT05-19]